MWSMCVCNLMGIRQGKLVLDDVERGWDKLANALYDGRGGKGDF